MKTTLKILTTLFVLTCSLTLAGAEAKDDAPVPPCTSPAAAEEITTVTTVTTVAPAPIATTSNTKQAKDLKQTTQTTQTTTQDTTPTKVKSAYVKAQTQTKKAKEVPMSKMIVKTILAFSLVVGLMVLIAFAYKYLLSKTGYVCAKGAGQIKIIERSMLDAKKQICLIKVKNKEYLLLTETGSSAVVLDKFDSQQTAPTQEKQG